MMGGAATHQGEREAREQIATQGGKESSEDGAQDDVDD